MSSTTLTTSLRQGNGFTLRVSHKLALMSGFLICALLYFAVTVIVERSKTVAEMRDLQSVTVLFTSMGNLTHEMQKERGMTGGFLESKGQKLKSELQGQLKETDKRLGELGQLLKTFDERRFGGNFEKALAAALDNLRGISDKRRAVDDLSISGGEALEFYSQAIGGLLGMTSQLSILTTNAGASRLALVYSNLLYAKENTGVERAILTNTFASDKFAEGLFQKFIAKISAQDVYTNSFVSVAVDAQKTFYQQTVTGPSIEEVARLRKIAMEKAAEGGFGIDPSHWFNTATQRIDLLKKVEDRLAADLVDFANQEKHNAQSVMMLYIALTLLLVSAALLIVFLVTRGIIRSLRSAVTVAEAIAKGDLTGKIEISSKDETGTLLQSLETMQLHLAETVSSIKESTDTISTASREIAQGNADLSSRTEEQASSLEETASSMEELTSTVKQNAENAKQANQLAAGASEVAVKGGAVVGQVVQTMSSINESSKKIVDIIGVIDGIAFQTNILALNAAVEAARAGEQGRGFAVVATEVRTLAQRSAAAAKEIKELISDSVHKVEDGTRLVDQAGKTMDEIVSSVKRVTDIMAEISAASQEQSSGIEQVNQAITQMDEVTQQNAALVEEAAAAAESMQEQAQNLTQAVSVFKLAHEQHAARAMPVAALSQPKAEVRQLTPRAKAKPQVPAKVAAAGAAPAHAKTGTDGEWKEF